jgi:two-component system response regulator NreC
MTPERSHPSAEPERLRIVLADDHAVVRAGIRMLLDEVPGWEVVAECGDADAAARQCRGYHPDVLLLDLTMPGRPSLEVLPELRRTAPEIRVVILTMEADPNMARAALAAGAAGYVLKQGADNELVDAIRRAGRGGALRRCAARRRGAEAGDMASGARARAASVVCPRVARFPTVAAPR